MIRTGQSSASTRKKHEISAAAAYHDDHEHDHDHDHSHGLIDRSILRSHEGVKAVAHRPRHPWCHRRDASLLIFALSGSVALLADLIHNFGDALTAIPLGIAFYLRSVRGERLAGLAVVARDLRISVRGSLRHDHAASSTRRTSPTSGYSPAAGADRLRRERARGAGSALGRSASRERSHDRRREARQDRRLRLARRRRERGRWSRSALRSPTRSSVWRSRS